MVFRVPRDHDGRGVVCPDCRRLLRIPGPDDTPPPLVFPADSGKRGGKRKRRSDSRRSGHRWESREGGDDDSPRLVARRMLWLLAGGVSVLALIMAAVFFTMRGGSPGPAVSVTVPEQAPQPVRIPPEPSGVAGADLLTDAETLAGRFLSATRVDEILPLVRDPRVAEPRIRAFYPDGLIDAPGMSVFDSRAQPVRHQDHLAVHVRTADFEERLMALFIMPGGLKIDWESWVGWSEMPWDEFLIEKPAEPRLFRVRLKAVHYYNFAFADDRKWCSWLLESPDGKHAVYGYVERGSALESRLKPPSERKKSDLTLHLAFPENAVTGNQVIVRGLVAEGWVTGTGG